MALALDHVFICCSIGAPEAAALARVGLKEGWPNTHPGQGTACRRFFFRNAYLELLWVTNGDEARSERARPTRLWERWSGRGTDTCPFALVLRPDGDVDGPPPFEAWAYRPEYLPPDLSIQIARGTPLSEPELFYLGFARAGPAASDQPVAHGIPANEITEVRIGIPGPGPRSSPARAVQSLGLVTFETTDQYLMTLTFDGAAAGATADLRPGLPLILRW